MPRPYDIVRPNHTSDSHLVSRPAVSKGEATIKKALPSQGRWAFRGSTLVLPPARGRTRGAVIAGLRDLLLPSCLPALAPFTGPALSLPKDSRSGSEGVFVRSLAGEFQPGSRSLVASLAPTRPRLRLYSIAPSIAASRRGLKGPKVQGVSRRVGGRCCRVVLAQGAFHCQPGTTKMVGGTGLEPVASAMSTLRSNQLS